MKVKLFVPPDLGIPELSRLPTQLEQLRQEPPGEARLLPTGTQPGVWGEGFAQTVKRSDCH